MWLLSLFARLVRFSCRHAALVALIGIALAIGEGVYVSGHFAMDSNSENLISPDVDWRQRQIAYDKEFPQRIDLTLVVIDGATPERAEQAAVALKGALAQHEDLFPVARDIQGSDFFAHEGLLFLSLDEVRDTTQHIIDAQPFLGPLAADPSLRGIMDGLSSALLGVENGAAKLDDLERPLNGFAQTLETVNSGRTGFLSWQELITGQKSTTRETRRLIEIQAALDYGALAPGSSASTELRQLAVDLGLTPENGVTVRLTGPVPISDEEFLSLTDRAALMAFLMIAAILVTLWAAVRSLKIVAAILVTLFAGLAITMGIGLAVIGQFNVISVAFIPLFVGIGVDFGIQYSVRYRAERHAHLELEPGLDHAGIVMGPPLTLAAIATAACFYSFVPTRFSGVAELGFIAGNGMLIAFLLNGTLLPALLKLMNPSGEKREIGFGRLAAVDQFLFCKRRTIVICWGVLTVAGLALMPSLTFDANPYDLRSNTAESMATLYDLMKDSATSPNSIEILAPSLAEAQTLAARVAQLPEVDHATTLESFVPEQQMEKIALISDAALLLDTTLNPFDLKPVPSLADIRASMTSTRDRLRKDAGTLTTPTAQAARRMATALDMIANADAATLDRATAAFVPGLMTVLDRLRASLDPMPVDLNSLPPELKRDWVAPDGQARVEASPKADANDNAALQRFADAVSAVAPNATGAPVSTTASGRTIVNAFIEAGILSFLAMIALLILALRSARDVVLTLGPLLAASVLTFATCVVIGLPINFANIIVLPLLLGIGVAFHIYFVMAWREGGQNFLQSSLSRAVLFSALTTATGFGTLWLSRHPGTASMGELLMISLFWTLTTLFFLPALLGWAKAR
jgi:hopanoid biosynthesis associated RND transporter like protein HpnN